MEKKIKIRLFQKWIYGKVYKSGDIVEVPESLIKQLAIKGICYEVVKDDIKLNDKV